MKWPFQNPFRAQKDVDVPAEDVDAESTEEEEDESDLGDIHFGEEISPESEAKTLNKKAILGGVGVAALVLVTAISSNHFSKENAGDKPLGNHGIASAATPADQLPEKYSDIEKQQKKNPPGSQSRTDQRGQVPAEPRMQVPVSSTPSSRGSQPVNLVPSEPTRSGAANPSISEAEKKAAKEAEAVNDSELAFRIAAAVSRGEPVAESQSLSNAGPMAGNRAVMTSTNVQGYGDYGEDVQGSYILNAGAVIQATLLTGITSDIPNGDVVAQVRQNIYDSLTGTHLLIPQGSRIIGKSSSAGGLGNQRIGVTFYRIILPNGASLMLPDQQAIDGTGYPGLADKYTEHSGRLYRTAFLSALFAAAAQSATGNTSGSDNRSPGQEAVAGAAASILNTGNRLIERDANIGPTIEIEPGFQFSVFVNQDLAVGEYHAY